MLIKTGYSNILHAVNFFLLTWWIINEFHNLLSQNNIMNLVYLSLTIIRQSFYIITQVIIETP